MFQFSHTDILVIVGLGNPGPKYHLTRHNIGFLFVDEFVDAYGGSWRSVGNCAMATIFVDERPLMLVKPQTFMNSSGDVWHMLSKKGIKPEQMLVVHDELEKKFGTFQIRQGGSARGHNGLRSLIARAGENFWRLRLGIDRPAQKEEVPSYVLASFSKNEQDRLQELFLTVIQQL